MSIANAVIPIGPVDALAGKIALSTVRIKKMIEHKPTTRPSSQFQGFDGEWYHTEQEALAKNREWTAPYSSGISGPSVLTIGDELGDRKVLSCVGCRHFLVREFTVYIQPQEEVYAGFLRAHQDAVPGRNESYEHHFCRFSSSEAFPYKKTRLYLSGKKILRRDACPVYNLADKA